jgi:hypothetical protein
MASPTAKERIMKNRLYALTPMTKREFILTVAELGRSLDYLVHITWNSPQGYPNLTLVKAPRVIFAECERDTPALIAPQRQWLDTLDACPGVERYIWHPGDMPAIREILGMRYDFVASLLGEVPLHEGDIIATQNGINKAFDRIFGRTA